MQHRQALLCAHLPLLAAILSSKSGRPASLDIPDSATFLEFAHRHSLGPTLAVLLDAPTLRTSVPEDVRESLNLARAAETIRSARLLASLQQIGNALDAAGLEWTLLKGLGLAARYYAGLDCRITRDIDILVRAEDLRSAEAVLTSLACRRASWVPFRALALQVTHGFDYVMGDRTIDLHWTLARHVSFRFDLDELWSRRQLISLGEFRAAIPSDEDALASYLVSAFSDLQRRGLSARALVDMYRMIDACHTSISWSAFLEHRKREGTYAVTVNMLALVLDVLDARDAFPAVADAVSGANDVVRLDRAGYLGLLAPGRYALANKLWALRLYDAPVARSLAWWGASLPLRFLVHRGWQDRSKRIALERVQSVRHQ